MITDERIAELKDHAAKYPHTFHRLVYGEDVLGLIFRVETAEANAQRVAEQHLARAGGIDIDRVPELSDREAADLIEQTLALPNFEANYGSSFGDFLRGRVAVLRARALDRCPTCGSQLRIVTCYDPFHAGPSGPLVGAPALAQQANGTVSVSVPAQIVLAGDDDAAFAKAVRPVYQRALAEQAQPENTSIANVAEWPCCNCGQARRKHIDMEDGPLFCPAFGDMVYKALREHDLLELMGGWPKQAQPVMCGYGHTGDLGSGCRKMIPAGEQCPEHPQQAQPETCVSCPTCHLMVPVRDAAWLAKETPQQVQPCACEPHMVESCCLKPCPRKQAKMPTLKATPSFIQTLENPPPPNALLSAAFERHSREVESRPDEPTQPECGCNANDHVCGRELSAVERALNNPDARWKLKSDAQPEPEDAQKEAGPHPSYDVPTLPEHHTTEPEDALADELDCYAKYLEEFFPHGQFPNDPVITITRRAAAALRAVSQPTREQIERAWFGCCTDAERIDAVLALYGKSEAKP